MAKRETTKNDTGLLDRLWQVWEKLSQFSTVATSVSGGGLMTVAAYFTDWMSNWGLLGLATVAVVAASFIYISLSLAGLVRSAARERNQRSEYLALASEQGDSINPLQDTFRNKIVKINDLFVPHMQLLQSKNFKECHIIGPGIVALRGNCNLFECGFDMSCNFIVVDYRKKHFISGLVGFENAHFEKCVFVNTTFILDENLAAILKKNIPGVPENKFMGFDYEAQRTTNTSAV
ncbi:MAG: hypothetical protein IOC49_06385 [Methylobacterium sp.]|nr:hypothetical protein [Methylobacterium sp.]